MDYGPRGEHMTTGGWIFMALGMLVLILLAVVLVVWVMSQQHKPDRSQIPPGMSAGEVLDHRLVSGEITADQYDQLRRKLDVKSPSSGSGPPTEPVHS
jgi:uncharacterized membrane protein